MLRSLPHGCFQAGLQFVPLALQEEASLLGLFPVSLFGDCADAGPRAAVDLELHAGPSTLAIDVDIAVPDLEEAIDQFGGPIGGAGGEEGTEVEGAILLHLPGHKDLGKAFRQVSLT